MAKQKQHQLSKVDYALFVAGFISITFTGYFIGSLFAENVAVVIIDVILYLALVAMYIQLFRTSSRTQASVQFVRVVSYIGIIMAVLIVAFFASFSANFRW